MTVTAKYALVLMLLGVAASGCGPAGDGDKAGETHAPATVSLGAADDPDQPDAEYVRYFADRVRELSDGSVRVRVIWDAGGEEVTDREQRIARMVRAGDLDLGWIGARAWDQLGVTSFQALQAPFLVTNHGLLGEITTGPLGERMLAGLERQDIVGLALVPDRLRYPMGARHPLASLEDFAGAHVRVFPSRATDTLIRALGATPVHVSGDELAKGVAEGEIDGAEASLGTNSPSEGESFVAPNLVLFAKALTLFAGADGFEQLDEAQREAIRDAARQTVEHVAAHPLSESELIRGFCEGSSVSAVDATPDDVAALQRAARSAYAELERDAQTRDLIVAIRELKAAAPQPPEATAASGCRHEATRTTTARDPGAGASTLNGTYRWRLTEAGAIASGIPDDRDVGAVQQVELRDGHWAGGDASGTYTIDGDRLVIDWPEESISFTFAFQRRESGDLDLEPAEQMDPGDRYNWTSETWRRVGPPLGQTP